MKYSNIVKTNENFQYSVNLQFDLYNINKIKNYVLTNDACEILKFYANSILNDKKNRSTTLIGPYGKGKSHLLLVFLTLISDYNEQDSRIIDEFINRIKVIDIDLYNLFVKIRIEKIKLLPIIINSNYDDINQAFLLGLMDAFEREKIDGLVINTYFDIAYDIIVKWEHEYKEIVKDIKKCLEEYNCSISELKKNLKKYSRKHYEIFKDVYKCISRGQEFNPLINGDIIKIYKDINYELSKNGYSGIFIAFDEFSKFLESSTDGLMRDLKILQDFAELAPRTGNKEQLHLCCITHKFLNEYFKDDENKINAFNTVEGRFKAVYFNRSLEQNYEIVSNSIIKENDFYVLYKKFYDEHKEFYTKIKEMNIFLNANFVEKNLFEGCFPLNPITVYAMIQLSEKIAQNERTLFTFITDNDQNSFKNFIDNNDSGLFNVDKIYDYFKHTLKKIDDSYIKNIYQKTEILLKKNISDSSKRILKVIAIIYMIKDIDSFPPIDEVISLSLFMREEYKIAIDELINKSILRRKKITNELDFATTYSSEITKEVKLLVDSKFDNINIKDTLNKIVDNWYSLPRKYNDQYKMTRFFLNIFMTDEELQNISSFDSLFDKYYCDGIIINLLKVNKNIENSLENFRVINDDRVVLKISKLSINKKFENLLKEYEAINYIKHNGNMIDETLNELEIMEKEIVDAIQEVTKEIFSEGNVQQYLYMTKSFKRVQHVSKLLSKICEEIYNKTPRINNEMINKLELQAPIKKARNVVIDSILTHNINLISSPTSAEATIYKAIVGKKDEELSISNILELIKNFIKSTDNNKRSFKELYNILLNKPYSVRKGVIPILLSLALCDYSDNTLLHYLDREINLNSETLVKINDNPDKYFIEIEIGTSDKIDYITNLMTIFSVPKTSDSLMINVRKTVEEMRKWIFSMPRLIRECSNGDELGVKNEYINIKTKLLRPDINNNEFLFTNILEIINQDDYSSIIVEINKMKNQFDGLMRNYMLELIEDTKEIFIKDYKGSLNSLFKDWTKNISINSKYKIHDSVTKKFIDYIISIDSHDENEIIENLSNIITGFYIEDWQTSEREKYLETMHDICEKLITKTKDENVNNKILIVSENETIEKNLIDNNNLSALGSTMMNNIEELIDEYGESLSEQEKVNILINILKKYL